MKNLLRKIYVHITIVPFYWYYRFFFNPKAGKKNILLDLKENHFKRYLYLLIKFLHLQGYTIYINRNFNLLYELKKENCVSFLFDEKIVNLGVPPSQTELINLNDQVLSADYFSSTSTEKNQSPENVCFIPMAQHPLMYHAGWWNVPLENVKRKRSLFMAGNFDEQIYDTIKTDDLFSVLSRTDVYSFLNRKKLLLPIKSMNDLHHFFTANNDNQILLLDRLQMDVPMNELRDWLSKFDFFFALPGITIPFSHNIIEAMSAGCIPFIQWSYADMFMPPLCDGKQVITFDNSDDLENKIDYLFSLAPDEIELLRKGVNEYYNNFLIPSSVVASMEACGFNKIYLQAESHSVTLLRNNVIKENALKK
ncbi:hypothetical protein QWZ08_14045 [Ferruginibacter paludis]|uniref:hypothetical protein n=1 Tax=Ferruginibacter paludis TaxID=1310417 RepID=UPI0025B42BED|nr:hypothetical protein [Ferruginibacter paludis]MDN3656763.1 hypothetical protein [Ferruginibacter paludis]